MRAWRGYHCRRRAMRTTRSTMTQARRPPQRVAPLRWTSTPTCESSCRCVALMGAPVLSHCVAHAWSAAHTHATVGAVGALTRCHRAGGCPCDARRRPAACRVLARAACAWLGGGSERSGAVPAHAVSVHRPPRRQHAPPTLGPGGTHACAGAVVFTTGLGRVPRGCVCAAGGPRGVCPCITLSPLLLVLSLPCLAGMNPRAAQALDVLVLMLWMHTSSRRTKVRAACDTLRRVVQAFCQRG